MEWSERQLAREVLKGRGFLLKVLGGLRVGFVGVGVGLGLSCI